MASPVSQTWFNRGPLLIRYLKWVVVIFPFAVALTYLPPRYKNDPPLVSSMKERLRFATIAAVFVAPLAVWRTSRKGLKYYDAETDSDG
jgi:hypothetical protein